MRKHRTSQAGSVTAELAVTLPALTAILALLLVGAVVGVTQLRLEEAARGGARAAARGESAAVVVSTARRIAGPEADVDVTESGRWVRVRVSGTVKGPLADLVSWPLVADAAAKREASLSAPGGSILGGSTPGGSPAGGSTPSGSLPPDEVAPAGEFISSSVTAAQLRPQGPVGSLRGNTA